MEHGKMYAIATLGRILGGVTAAIGTVGGLLDKIDPNTSIGIGAVGVGIYILDDSLQKYILAKS